MGGRDAGGGGPGIELASGPHGALVRTLATRLRPGGTAAACLSNHPRSFSLLTRGKGGGGGGETARDKEHTHTKVGCTHGDDGRRGGTRQ